MCPDYSNKVPHGTHWHVIRADNITIAGGQCPGYEEETDDGNVSALQR